jgi:hypothetical protein
VSQEPDGPVTAYFNPATEPFDKQPPGQPVTAREARAIADTFLLLHFESLGLDRLENRLKPAGVSATQGLYAVRSKQVTAGGFRVLDCDVTIDVRRDTGAVIGCFSTLDPGIPIDFDMTPRVLVPTVPLNKPEDVGLSFVSEHPKHAEPTVYRFFPTDIERHGLSTGSEKSQVLRRWFETLSQLPTGKKEWGEVCLVWRRRVAVRGSSHAPTVLEVLVDASTGESLEVFDLSDYTVTGTGKVFIPDPVTASNDENLRLAPNSTLTAQPVLPRDPFLRLLKRVKLLGLDPPQNGKLRLRGQFSQEEGLDDRNRSLAESSSGRFFFGPDEVHLWSVMAYFWIDQVQRHIQRLGVDAARFSIKVDSQATSTNRSEYLRADRSIRLALGNSPDAADAAVIVHEYGHAIQHDQGFSGSPKLLDLREGWADILARLFLDRFTPPNACFRTLVFPFEPEADRRVDLPNVYSPDFDTFGAYICGDVWAGSVWNIYLALGGESAKAVIRKKAADLVLRLHLDANSAFGTVSRTSPRENHSGMAFAMLIASETLTDFPDVPGGVCHKVIESVFVEKELFKMAAVDLFLRDGRPGTYEFMEADALRRSPDLVVRRRATDRPEGDDQAPVANRPNFLWVRVRTNIQTKKIAVAVSAFLDAGSILTLPGATSLGRQTKLWSQDDPWVGPFEFRPDAPGPITLLAAVDAEEDPSILLTKKPGQISSRWLVLLDNNIAQRVVTAVPS